MACTILASDFAAVNRSPHVQRKNSPGRPACCCRRIGLYLESHEKKQFQAFVQDYSATGGGATGAGPAADGKFIVSRSSRGRCCGPGFGPCGLAGCHGLDRHGACFHHLQRCRYSTRWPRCIAAGCGRCGRIIQRPSRGESARCSQHNQQLRGFRRLVQHVARGPARAWPGGPGSCGINAFRSPRPYPAAVNGRKKLLLRQKSCIISSTVVG